MTWKPISTIPTHHCQVLVTDEDFGEEGNSKFHGFYSAIELINLPAHSDGRIMNQNSCNYSNIRHWLYWTEVPERIFEP